MLRIFVITMLLLIAVFVYLDYLVLRDCIYETTNTMMGRYGGVEHVIRY
jgi:hypothetical protein